MDTHSQIVFRDLNISESTLQALEKKGFTHPSPIQEKIIPILLESRGHVIGQAQTGTGKTAAFGIPIIERLDPSLPHTQAIILTPTRELCMQVCDEISSFRNEKHLNIVPVYGGQSITVQLSKLKKKPHIIVGTPGRVIDHLERGSLKIDQIQFFVLDEADEMFSMGFQQDVETIMGYSSASKPQILLFSATFPKAVKSLVKKYIPVHEQVAVTPEESTTALITQEYYMVPSSHKFQSLTRILDTTDDFYGIIFCQTKVSVQELVHRLIDKGYRAADIHGDLSQAQRESTLKKFKKHHINILVATDVAARGIDVQDLTHVINYALPQDPEAYVHRIGRTGRAGKKGIAISLVSQSEYAQLLQIQRIAKVTMQKATLPSVEDLITRRSQVLLDDIQKLSRSSSNTTKDLFYVNNLSGDLIEAHPDDDPQKLVSLLLQYFAKDTLIPSNYGDIQEDKATHQASNMKRVFIALGKTQGATKESIHQLLLEHAQMDPQDIEDILILENFSFASIPFLYASAIVKEEKKHAGFKRKPLITFARDRESSFRSYSRDGGERPRRKFSSPRPRSSHYQS